MGDLVWEGIKAAPHSPQNLNWGGLAAWHWGQIRASRVPHSPQNFNPSGF
jgi:hypothetical protein